MKASVQVGDWFGVPLRTGGWAVGLLTRHDGPTCSGYFFGPTRDELPDVHGLEGLSVEDAVLAVPDFGDLGFLNGEWPRIGPSDAASSGEWPALAPNGSVSGYGVVELKLTKALSAE